MRYMLMVCHDESFSPTETIGAETKEQVAGYDIIECEDLDEAVEVVSGHPMAKAGTIEIRPFPEA
jgi:hypothetical protein